MNPISSILYRIPPYLIEGGKDLLQTSSTQLVTLCAASEAVKYIAHYIFSLPKEEPHSLIKLHNLILNLKKQSKYILKATQLHEIKKELVQLEQTSTLFSGITDFIHPDLKFLENKNSNHHPLRQDYDQLLTALANFIILHHIKKEDSPFHEDLVKQLQYSWFRSPIKETTKAAEAKEAAKTFLLTNTSRISVWQGLIKIEQLHHLEQLYNKFTSQPINWEKSEAWAVELNDCIENAIDFYEKSTQVKQGKGLSEQDHKIIDQNIHTWTNKLMDKIYETPRIDDSEKQKLKSQLNALIVGKSSNLYVLKEIKTVLHQFFHKKFTHSSPLLKGEITPLVDQKKELEDHSTALKKFSLSLTAYLTFRLFYPIHQLQEKMDQDLYKMTQHINATDSNAPSLLLFISQIKKAIQKRDDLNLLSKSLRIFSLPLIWAFTYCSYMIIDNFFHLMFAYIDKKITLSFKEPFHDAHLTPVKNLQKALIQYLDALKNDKKQKNNYLEEDERLNQFLQDIQSEKWLSQAVKKAINQFLYLSAFSKPFSNISSAVKNIQKKQNWCMYVLLYIPCITLRVFFNICYSVAHVPDYIISKNLQFIARIFVYFFKLKDLNFDPKSFFAKPIYSRMVNKIVFDWLKTIQKNIEDGNVSNAIEHQTEKTTKLFTELVQTAIEILDFNKNSTQTAESGLIKWLVEKYTGKSPDTHINERIEENLVQLFIMAYQSLATKDQIDQLIDKTIDEITTNISSNKESHPIESNPQEQEISKLIGSIVHTSIEEEISKKGKNILMTQSEKMEPYFEFLDQYLFAMGNKKNIVKIIEHAIDSLTLSKDMGYKHLFKQTNAFLAEWEAQDKTRRAEEEFEKGSIKIENSRLNQMLSQLHARIHLLVNQLQSIPAIQTKKDLATKKQVLKQQVQDLIKEIQKEQTRFSQIKKNIRQLPRFAWAPKWLEAKQLLGTTRLGNVVVTVGKLAAVGIGLGIGIQVVGEENITTVITKASEEIVAQAKNILGIEPVENGITKGLDLIIRLGLQIIGTEETIRIGLSLSGITTEIAKVAGLGAAAIGATIGGLEGAVKAVIGGAVIGTGAELIASNIETIVGKENIVRGISIGAQYYRKEIIEIGIKKTAEGISAIPKTTAIQKLVTISIGCSMLKLTCTRIKKSFGNPFKVLPNYIWTNIKQRAIKQIRIKRISPLAERTLSLLRRPVLPHLIIRRCLTIPYALC